MGIIGVGFHPDLNEVKRKSLGIISFLNAKIADILHLNEVLSVKA